MIWNIVFVDSDTFKEYCRLQIWRNIQTFSDFNHFIFCGKNKANISCWNGVQWTQKSNCEQLVSKSTSFGASADIKILGYHSIFVGGERLESILLLKSWFSDDWCKVVYFLLSLALLVTSIVSECTALMRKAQLRSLLKKSRFVWINFLPILAYKYVRKKVRCGEKVTFFLFWNVFKTFEH